MSNASVPGQGDTMLDLFVSMLEVRLRTTPTPASPDPFAESLLDEVRSAIAKEKEAIQAGDTNWNEAYRLERLLAAAAPADIVALELDRRVNEVLATAAPFAVRAQADVSVAKKAAYDSAKQPPELRPGGVTILRNALTNLLEEIHWEDQRKFFVSPILKEAIRKTVFLGVVIFIIVVAPYFWLSAVLSQTDPVEFTLWPWFPLYTAIMFGGFGAFFSRLIELLLNGERLTVRETQNAANYRNLFLRGAVGMSGALFLFFFLKSGLISGGMFPDFGNMGLEKIDFQTNMKAITSQDQKKEYMRVVVPSSGVALLAVWSFLAGFSERLVPTVLSNTEASLQKASNLTGSKED